AGHQRRSEYEAVTRFEQCDLWYVSHALDAGKVSKAATKRSGSARGESEAAGAGGAPPAQRTRGGIEGGQAAAVPQEMGVGERNSSARTGCGGVSQAAGQVAPPA